MVGLTFVAVLGLFWFSAASEDLDYPFHGNDSCYSIQNCTACSLTHTCHWCAHDNACHIIGSVYGCAVGVNCYSEDRCMRKEPEKVDRKDFESFPRTPLLAWSFVWAVSCLLCSFCCCLRPRKIIENNNLEEWMVFDDFGSPGVDTTTVFEQLHGPDEDAPAEDEPEQDGDQVEEPNDVINDSTIPLTAIVPDNQAAISRLEEDEHDDYHDEEEPADLTEPLLEQQDPQMTPRPNRTFRATEEAKTQFLSSVCRWTAALIPLLLASVVIMVSWQNYPRQPIYNVCNDEVAWKSIFASLQLNVDLEQLVSVANPTPIDVRVRELRGSLEHVRADGTKVYIGSFELEQSENATEVVVQAGHVSDILVMVHIQLGGVNELAALTTAYSKGSLMINVFNVSLQAYLPFLKYTLAYTIPGDVMTINANDQSDRHICACPQW